MEYSYTKNGKVYSGKNGIDYIDGVPQNQEGSYDDLAGMTIDPSLSADVQKASAGHDAFIKRNQDRKEADAIPSPPPSPPEYPGSLLPSKSFMMEKYPSQRPKPTREELERIAKQVYREALENQRMSNELKIRDFKKK